MRGTKRPERTAYLPAAVAAAWAEWNAALDHSPGGTSDADCEQRVVEFFQRVSALLAAFEAGGVRAEAWPVEVKALVDDLSPRLHDVLLGLLRGDGEKQVAQSLKLSPHTVHEYVKLLYATFHVSSRSELLARFITLPEG